LWAAISDPAPKHGNHWPPTRRPRWREASATEPAAGVHRTDGSAGTSASPSSGVCLCLLFSPFEASRIEKK
jgi:hypothetical protein